MSKGRLEAFSDGVIAILITIMVLELKVPEGATLGALRPLVSVILAYTLSFVFLGIYWNNHHHLFQATTRVNGAILWANLHLLFWLSLTPFVTAWMGQNGRAPVPTAAYGVVQLASGAAYNVLVQAILKLEGPRSLVAQAVGGDRKGNLSLLLYAIAVPMAFATTIVSQALYVTVALMWLVPDRRIESRVAGAGVSAG